MLPTLAARGDWIIEDRLSVRRDPVTFARGEIITLKSPQDPLQIVCKRIVGLPGDTICVDPTGQYAPSSEHIVVPRGHVWVNGDNLPYSRDSRRYGPVPMGLIQGRAVLKVGCILNALQMCANLNVSSPQSDFWLMLRSIRHSRPYRRIQVVNCIL